jgi:hypothetical protein
MSRAFDWPRCTLLSGLPLLPRSFSWALMASMVLSLMGGCMSSPPRQSRVTRMQTVENSRGSNSVPAKPISPNTISLLPEKDASPATLRNNDYHQVTGEYVYADLETILKLVGHVGGHEVTRVRFFEGVAAAVTVGNKFGWTVYLFSKDVDRVWHIVAWKDYNH